VKNQKGKVWILGLIPVALVVMVTAIMIFSYIRFYNYGNQAENVIRAEYTNMENILAQYGLQIGEAAQIPAMQADDLTRIFTNTLDARYGSDGSQAAFQWLQEQNPQLDQSTYREIQTLITAGRNRFENAQTRFIDTKRVYETNLGYLWSGFWLRFTGYPKINLDDYTIITSSRARDAFDTGIDQGIQLR
jgi:hypothetical protein